MVPDLQPALGHDLPRGRQGYSSRKIHLGFASDEDVGLKRHSAVRLHPHFAKSKSFSFVIRIGVQVFHVVGSPLSPGQVHGYGTKGQARQAAEGRPECGPTPS